jgi:hypothetical protein
MSETNKETNKETKKECDELYKLWTENCFGKPYNMFECSDALKSIDKYCYTKPKDNPINNFIKTLIKPFTKQ